MRLWLVDLTYTQQTIAADVIPAAIGGIATYSEQRFPNDEPIRIFKYPETLISALADCIPEAIGFSNYVWNGDLAYGFASAIKAKSPGTVVIFGGPNYPASEDEQKNWLRAHTNVDFYVIKEGELAFANLVQALKEENLNVEHVKRRKLESIHCVLASGQFHLGKEIERIRDLSEIPSPYTSGRLDEFFDGKLLPIIQTNRGCPFGCTFCIEGDSYYNKLRTSSTEKVSSELNYIGAKMRNLRERGGRNDLFIADSNFGMYKDDIATAHALAETSPRFGWPEYINVATGKNQKERVLEASRIIDGALRLSGSVQSLSPVVLENIKRKNIDAKGLFDLGLAAREVGANTYSEIILALPGDTLHAHFDTVRVVMDAGFTNIYLFQLMLLPGTEMATPESKAKYGMVTKYRVLPRCYGNYEVLGRKIGVAEIEEICVANSTLSYEDYLRARRFHLFVTIYHNDGIFEALLKRLRMHGISVFGWMQRLNDAPLTPGLEHLFGMFDKATREELWDSREDLQAFVRDPEVIERYLAGELGNNLLFVHKTLAITRYLRDLASVARTTMVGYLREAGIDGPEIERFIDDVIAYQCVRAENLFQQLDSEPVELLQYDIPRFLDDSHPSAISEYRFPLPVAFTFFLDDVQKNLIQRNLKIYGDSTVSIGRILSKIHVKKMFRNARRIERQTAECASEREGSFYRSGLQE